VPRGTGLTRTDDGAAGEEVVGEPARARADDRLLRTRWRVPAAIVLFGSPIYLAPTGPLLLAAAPALAWALGPRVWPGRTAGASLWIGALTALALLMAVIVLTPFYFLCRPEGGFAGTGGPLAAFVVYAAGAAVAYRRPRAWPFAVLLAAVAADVVAQIAIWRGAELVC
jgi:hypothetical protein